MKPSNLPSVSMIVVNYNGEVNIERLDDTAYEMEIVGKGKDAKGRGSASMKMTGNLHQSDEEGTEIAMSMEITITGKLAQFGSRMIVDVSNKMFEQFIRNFENNLRNPEGSAEAEGDKPVDAIPLISSVVKSTITGLFKGKDKKEKDDS